MQLARTMLSKLARLAGVLVIVTLFAALLVSLVPGDPAEVIAPFASDGQRETIRDELNLNDPIPVQYDRSLGDFVTVDFGNFSPVSCSRPLAARIPPPPPPP